jgi:hypothetical protein
MGAWVSTPDSGATVPASLESHVDVMWKSGEAKHSGSLDLSSRDAAGYTCRTLLQMIISSYGETAPKKLTLHISLSPTLTVMQAEYFKDFAGHLRRPVPIESNLTVEFIVKVMGNHPALLAIRDGCFQYCIAAQIKPIWMVTVVQPTVIRVEPPPGPPGGSRPDEHALSSSERLSVLQLKKKLRDALRIGLRWLKAGSAEVKKLRADYAKTIKSESDMRATIILLSKDDAQMLKDISQVKREISAIGTRFGAEGARRARLSREMDIIVRDKELNDVDLRRRENIADMKHQIAVQLSENIRKWESVAHGARNIKTLLACSGYDIIRWLDRERQRKLFEATGTSEPSLDSPIDIYGIFAFYQYHGLDDSNFVVDESAAGLTRFPIAITDTPVDDDDDDEDACMMCFSSKKSITCMPCEHREICGTCCLLLERKNPAREDPPGHRLLCPYCRQPVTAFEADEDKDAMFFDATEDREDEDEEEEEYHETV